MCIITKFSSNNKEFRNVFIFVRGAFLSTNTLARCHLMAVSKFKHKVKQTQYKSPAGNYPQIDKSSLKRFTQALGV